MRKVGILLTIALLMALVPAVLAGGWAVITLDDMPGEIRAGEPWTIGFTVLQHGKTPVHDLGEGVPVEPTFVATNAANGRRVEAVATPTEEPGHFMLEVTFPVEGEWEWTIYPAPLATETMYEPLNVLPALTVAAPAEPAAAAVRVEESAPAVAPITEENAAAAPANSYSFPAALRWGALAVALIAAALLVVQNRRRAQPAEVKS